MMLRPAARLRALAGALACALILAAAMTHQVRADDAPGRMVMASHAAPPRAVQARRAHRMPLRARASTRIGRAWASSSHPLVTAALRDLGRGNFTGFRGPWCGAAADRWLARAGYRTVGSKRALDFARYGVASAPRPGALVVSRNHVGVLIRPGVMVSGNWGGRVRIGRPSGVIAYRAPV